MSLKPNDVIKMGRAERQFWEAFERLKLGKPKKLQSGAKVSQNNVAKEAGTVPSALRSTRYPDLCLAISQWIDERASDISTVQQGRSAERRLRRDLRDKINELEKQRDKALAKLVLVEMELVNLTMENQQLRETSPPSGNALQSRRRRRGHLTEV
jgi:hypothetical protein